MNVFRAALTNDFWMTGIAIVRYIPRAFRVKQLDGDLFFTEEKREEHRQRVESVTPNSPRQWGTMEVDQMLHHLNLACGGSQGFYDLPDESYLTSRTLFKWILVDWYPEQPVGLRLPTGFKIPHSQRFEFAYEKITTAENPGGRLERNNCKCVEAPPNVRQDDGKGVGQAFADSRGLSPETVRGLTE